MSPLGVFASAVDLLAPLAARYGAARGGPVVIPPEPDGVVRAMPIVLRLERPPAARTAVLEAAAAAALAVCLDPRADAEWHEALTTWVASRIRKIARRARGAHWAAVQELPGVTVAVGEAQARALVPGPVDDVPKVVSRLQIGGTDLEPDDPGPPPPGVPVIHVNAGPRDDGREGRRPGRARVDVVRGRAGAGRGARVRGAGRRPRRMAGPLPSGGGGRSGGEFATQASRR